MPRPAARIVFPAVLVLALASGAPAWAQGAQPPAGGVRLSGTPLQVDSMGLTLYAPEGSSAQTSTYGTTTATRIETPEGIAIAIQSRQSKDGELAAKDIGDGVISQMTGARARLMTRNDTLIIGELPADRFYLEVAGEDGPVVRGYTIVRPEAGRFVIFELFTPKAQFERARGVYETTVATARFADMGDVGARRAGAVRAGVSLFESLSASDLDAVVARQGERWERLYSPAKTGSDTDATEHGYRRVRSWVGKRGELSGKKDESAWTEADRQEGYLVQIDALLLETGVRIDSQAVYFLSRDRAEEAWTVRMAMRQGETVNRWTETGARMKSSMSVRLEQNGSPTDTIRPVIQGDGYISQVESFLLGPIIVHSGIASDFAFYTYQSQANTIRLRTDSAEKSDGPGGQWTLTTVIGETGRPQTSTYRPDGSLVRTALGDGRLWEPVELDRLVRLWRAKGLPMD
jgi:hypothetical protein